MRTKKKKKKIALFLLSEGTFRVVKLYIFFVIVIFAEYFSYVIATQQATITKTENK